MRHSVIRVFNAR